MYNTYVVKPRISHIFYDHPKRDKIRDDVTTKNHGKPHVDVRQVPIFTPKWEPRDANGSPWRQSYSLAARRPARPSAHVATLEASPHTGEGIV